MKVRNHILATVITGLIVLCLSCTTQTEAQKNLNQSSNQTVNAAEAQTSKNDSAVKNEVDTSKWKTYKDTKNGFSFRYPPNLILQKKSDKVRLYHSFKFPHQDPCDKRDNTPVLKNLTDFDITLKVVNKNFQTYKWAEYDRESEIKFGKTHAGGKIVSHAYDGCGYDEYIYPFKNAKSFVLEYQITGLFSPIYTDFPGASEALRQPDLIKNEEKLIKAILGSFEFAKK